MCSVAFCSFAPCGIHRNSSLQDKVSSCFLRSFMSGSSFEERSEISRLVFIGAVICFEILSILPSTTRLRFRDCIHATSSGQDII